MNVVLIDGLNLAFRWHFSNSFLSTKEGVKTGVIFGLLKTIPQLRQKLSGSADCSIVYCWEGGVTVPGSKKIPSWRKEIAKGYKALRQPLPDYQTIIEQVQKVSGVLSILGHPQAYLAGIEADDLIGILSTELSSRKDVDKVYILTTDRDMMQCISPSVTVVRPGKGTLEYYTPKRLFSEYSIYPEQWARYKALVGDSSDNYKGVPGVGPSKAVKLLAGGINPELPEWQMHPVSTRKAFPFLEQHWEIAHQCYLLSFIPRSVTFPLFSKEVREQLKENLANVDELLKPTMRTEADFKPRLAAWTRFCADHELESFMATRRDFFA